MANSNNGKNNSGPDSGWSWVIAASCCFINMMMYGMCRLAGQLFVITLQTYHVSRKEASFPYTLSSALRNASGPLVGYLGHKFGVRIVTAAGGLVGAAGIAICYAAADVTWIMIFWGVVFGIGFGLGNVLLPVSINQYFVKHRATASGISLSGACLGSFILPPLVDILISEYGLNGTFLILSGLLLNCVPAAMLLRKPSFTIERPTQALPNESEQCSDQYQTANDNPCFDMHSEDSGNTIIDNEDDGNGDGLKIPAVENGTKREREGSCNVINKSQTVMLEDVAPNCDKNDTLKKSLKLTLNPMFILIVLSVALYGYTFLLAITAIIDFALDIGVEQSKATYILMCFSIGDFIGRLGLAWTTDVGYMSMSNFAAICFLLQGATAVAIVFTSTFWGLMITVFIFGIFEAGLIVIIPLIIAHYIDHDLQTVAIPSSNILYGPMCLAVAPTIGYFRESIGSYAGVFYAIGGISLACSLAWFYVSSREYCQKSNKRQC